jgi:hypothetical protein
MFSRLARKTLAGMTHATHPASSRLRSDGEGPNSRGVSGGRTVALSGFAGAVLYLIGALLPGSPPEAAAAPSRIVAFFVDKRGALLTGFTLQLIALALLICFLGQLRTLVARSGALPAATAMTAAWVVLSATVLVGTLPAVALVWRGPPVGDPGLVRMAYDMQVLATYAASSTAAFVSIGAPSLVIWRFHILPRWLAVLGVAAMAANVMELAGLAFRTGALAGGYADGIGALLWALWVAAASISMARRAGPARVV